MVAPLSWSIFCGLGVFRSFLILATSVLILGFRRSDGFQISSM